MERVNITKKVIESFTPSEKTTEYGDLKVQEFRIRISPAGKLTFNVVKKRKGRFIRIKIGNYPQMPPERARAESKRIIAEIELGVHDQDKRAEKTAKALTLREALNELLASREYKPRTVFDYQDRVNRDFSDWLDMPIISITRSDVIDRHNSITERSKAGANSAFRVFRVVYNFAAARYRASDESRLFPENPCLVLSELKQWNPNKRKKRIIPSQKMSNWLHAVSKLEENESRVAKTCSVFFRFLLFTGLRSDQARSLQWKDLNLKRGSFCAQLKIQQNGETNFDGPLPDYLISILGQWRLINKSKWVFPSDDGESKLSENTLITWYRFVSEEIAFKWSPHDLRRTFSTLAESLDISQYAIKKLLSHATGDDRDVTAGYIISPLDRLRRASNQIADLILSFEGENKG
ncbi:integrase family protein [Shewanella sp. KX20019]|uniref:tyrosine-type recombinase/integrase n=1 Tax=Shewanella sp. KX20019 TaxID=2803864 RepID=UPI0019288D8A|nr:integrase family protein [Shewanella sp. KX20019]QQX80875.1 integrase family protein [Shewanella sp. KX20019]